MQDDLISREETLTAFADYVGSGMSMDDYDALWNIVEKMPPVNPQQKTGHWIMPVQDDGMSDPIYYQVRCSKCGFDLDPQTWHMELHQYGADKYCPKCGEKKVDSDIDGIASDKLTTDDNEPDGVGQFFCP